MQTDPLQQLRDIHVPAEPGWWPPAPGWWLLLVIVLGLLAWLVLWLRKRHANRAPQRYAVHLYQQLHARFVQQEISDSQYIHSTNQILKRLLIHPQQRKDAVQASDSNWLKLLDELDNSHNFSAGPGKVLGNARFAPSVELNNDAFDALIRQFLKAAGS